MKLKGNEKGFTLLELLVAVAILAVICIPFMFAFVTTSNINSKTKEQQRAKFAATNAMEEIRSKKVEDILKDSTTVANEDGTYTYTIEQTSDGRDYTCEAILDPRYESEENNKEATEYNAEKLAKIYGMNSAYDCFCEIDATQDTSKLEQLAEIRLGNRNNDTVEAIYKNVNREIVVTIKETEEGATQVIVKTIYKDMYNGAVNTVETQDQCIYSNSSEGVNLRGIYLFYSPLYNANKTTAKETITIENEDEIPCTVYVCRQDWPDNLSTDNEKLDKLSFPIMDYCEYESNKDRNNNYLVNLRLYENREDSEYIGDGKINVVTNIRTNIDDALKYYNTRSDKVLNPSLRLTYGNSKGNYALYKKLQGTAYPASQFMGLDNLAGKDDSDKVYHVTIRTYKGIGDSKESEVVYTLKSTTQ